MSNATQAHHEHRALKERSLTNRSRVSNGRDWLPGADQRSAPARRYRDLMSEAIADAGGIGQCSQAKLQLIRRLAALSVQLEALEARLADGEALDIAEYTALTSTLVRVVSRLGINRVARDVTSVSLNQYLNGRGASE